MSLGLQGLKGLVVKSLGTLGFTTYWRLGRKGHIKKSVLPSNATIQWSVTILHVKRPKDPSKYSQVPSPGWPRWVVVELFGPDFRISVESSFFSNRFSLVGGEFHKCWDRNFPVGVWESSYSKITFDRVLRKASLAKFSWANGISETLMIDMHH